MREQGYYWVSHYRNWIVAYWTGEFWLLAGNPTEMDDFSFESIDESRLDYEAYRRSKR